jgi:thiamine pyrophosphate-dependent acetolactate synthase large subunit-like protein
MLGFPVTNTLMGLGATRHRPKFLGMLGMHGTYEANMTMQNCDVLLAVGARFDDRVIGNPSTSPRSSARSSTSTSTRRRSPSASRWTSPSSAT